MLTANGQLYNRSRAVKVNPEIQKSRSAISLNGPVQKLLGLRWFSAVYTWLTQTFGQWKVSKTCRFNSNGGPYSPLARGQKVYVSLISYLFPCPAGQVLFQKICVPCEKVRVAIPWLFGIRDVSCGWFHGGKTMLTEKRNVHDFRSTCATKQSKPIKSKRNKNTQYPEHKENSTWAAKRPH